MRARYIRHCTETTRDPLGTGTLIFSRFAQRRSFEDQSGLATARKTLLMHTPRIAKTGGESERITRSRASKSDGFASSQSVAPKGSRLAHGEKIHSPTSIVRPSTRSRLFHCLDHHPAQRNTGRLRITFGFSGAGKRPTSDDRAPQMRGRKGTGSSVSACSGPHSAPPSGLNADAGVEQLTRILEADRFQATSVESTTPDAS